MKHNPDKYSEVDESINDLLDKGYLKMIKGKNGELLYQITEKGIQYAEKMKKIIEEEENGS